MGRISRNKRGQQAEPLNWIYILIAGAIILMFFVGIVVRQKGVSQQRLSSEISEKLSGIFTGALLSEETTNVIDIPDVTINFVCDGDGYSEFNIEHSPSSIETPFQPIFALPTIQSSRFILWSVKFNMPFTSGNLLMVSSPNTRIMVITDDKNPFWTDQRDALEDQFPDQLNVDFIPLSEYKQDSIAHEGDNSIRFVFMGDTIEEAKSMVPTSFQRLGDEQVTAVSIKSNTVDFYQKTGSIFSLDKRAIPLIPNTEEKNPALLGAIFAGNAQLYECNMRKAMQRLVLVGEVYGNRADALQKYYIQTNNNVCELTINPGLIIGENSLIDIARQCSETYDQDCFTLFIKADEIRENNECLQGKTPACSGRTGCGNIY